MDGRERGFVTKFPGFHAAPSGKSRVKMKRLEQLEAMARDTNHGIVILSINIQLNNVEE
jgi:hypothetical protein